MANSNDRSRWNWLLAIPVAVPLATFLFNFDGTAPEDYVTDREPAGSAAGKWREGSKQVAGTRRLTRGTHTVVFRAESGAFQNFNLNYFEFTRV